MFGSYPLQLEDLRQGPVAVLGAGREGMAAVDFLNRIAPDGPAPVVFNETVADVGRAELRVGSFATAALDDFAIVIKSPGISRYRPEITRLGSRLTSGTAIWCSHERVGKVLAITGTKGKSTTASLCAFLAERAGVRVQLGGNIGRPLLDFCPPDPAVELFVLELSSYQTCEVTGELDVGCVLNLHPAHLDWHGSFENYRADKLALLEHSKQRFCGPGVAATGAAKLPNDEGFHPSEGALWRGRNMLVQLDEFSLRGEHNRFNLAVAAELVAACDFDPVPGLQALQEFVPLPHRLELVLEKYGIRYVNDSIATHPAAVSMALRSFDDEPIVLLAGGVDNAQDWSPLLDTLDAQRHLLVCFGPGGRELLEQARARAMAPEHFAQLKAAFDYAHAQCHEGSVLLLSPGAASFDEFVNFEERGRFFARLACGSEG